MERNERTAGDEVGGYTIEKVLGAGASGTVYRAVDGGGTPVALKVLHRSLAATDGARERLVREVAALRKVEDDAFVTVLDAEVDADEAFVVTELVDGPSLEDEVLGGGPLDAHDTLELAEKLARALHAVHDAGLVHRDVKPSNILLADHGPVLIDFGIAQAVTDARVTSHGFVMGTPGYLAPELLDGAAPSPAGDWWGWAASIAFAVTGRAPFGVRPLEAVLGRVRAGDVDLGGAGPLTAAALRGALVTDPSARTSPDDVVEALREAVEAGETHAAVPAALLVGHAARSDADERPAEPDARVVEHEGTGPYGSGAGPRVTTSPGPANDGRTDVLRVPTGAFGTPAPAPEPEVPPLPGFDDVVAGRAVPTGGVALAAAAAAASHGIDPTLAVPAPDAGATTPLPAGADGSTRALPADDVPSPPAEATAVVPVNPYAPRTEVLPARMDDASVAPSAEEHTALEPAWEGDPLGDEVASTHDADGDGVPDDVEHARRPVAVLALAVPAAFALGLFPVVAMFAIVVIVVLVRSVGVTSDAVRTRRAARGRGRADGARATISYPWYLLKAGLTLLPALLVAGAVAAMFGGPLWWLLQTNRIVVSTHELGERGHGAFVAPAEGTTNATWVFVAALAVVGLVWLLLVWFGPLGWSTRWGARTILGHLAPGRGGTLFVVLVALALTGVGVLLVAVGMPIFWSPLGGPPNLS
ncbi:serine/threonine-protein kinase [Sanguibacter sp. HDW7]|uniref:serine/threonine protein kinase n=1 Tax=Sanguibacter sp. HDW7 TaxID=2714931 RepID=UPI00197CBF6A|nr:serine/threonine-protein kinase [Sanguibacter sp. HDW7]